MKLRPVGMENLLEDPRAKLDKFGSQIVHLAGWATAQNK
jgi:hypothetical protein